jgi:hypothetical protein
MHVLSSEFLNPTTLAIMETAFDEAWATLNGNGDKIKARRTRAVHAPSSDGGRA